MKKIFSLLYLVMLMFAVSANAQSRKTWDFSKGVSDESRAALDADASWTKTVADGVTTAWASASNINGEAMANGNVVKELSGLHFGNFAAVHALLYRITCIRLQKNCTVTLKDLKAGEKVVIKAQSAKPTATDRGFSLDNAQDAKGNSSFKCLGRDADGAPEGGVTTVEATVIADGDLTLSTGLNGAPASGIEILSIIVGDGDKNIKKWDFSAFSEATVNQVCAAKDWTTSESAKKNYITGNEIRWINTPALVANDDLTAGGEAIKELKGLRHDGLAQYSLGLAFNYGQTLDDNHWGPYKGGSYIWVMGTATKIIVPNVKSGSTLKLGVESHNPSDARGFKVLAGGVEVDTKTTIDYQEFSYAIPASADEYVDVEIVATKGCHLYFIEAEVKDETVVDKNPSLGSISVTPKTNTKISKAATDLIKVTFPKSKNILLSTPVTIDGVITSDIIAEDPEAGQFEGLEGNLEEGVSFSISDILFEGQIAENTTYTVTINKITVGEEGGAFYKVIEEPIVLVLTTKGPGIKEPRAWEFTTTKETAEAISASITNGFGVWGVAASKTKGRYYVSKPMENSPLYIADGVELPNTEGLLFTMNSANDILFGTPQHDGYNEDVSKGGNNGRMQFGGSTPVLIIPQCSAGDEVTIKALYASSSGSSLTIENGTVDGATSIAPLEKNAKEYIIIVSEDGDLVLKSKSVVYNSISIYPYNPNKKEYNYSVVAQTPEGEVLKTIAEGKELENTKVEGAYSYWLADSEGKLYTRGAKGTPFTYSAVINSEDPVVLEYAAKSFDGMAKVMFLSEAEDLAGVTRSDAANSAARSSNAKSAFAESDVELTVLPAGTYKIRVIIFDGNKNGGQASVTFSYGDNADEQVTLTSDAENFSEVETEVITLTEARQVIWKAGGDKARALDAVLIYQWDKALSVNGVAEANAAAPGVVKFAKDNSLLIKTAKGTFNAAGMQVK